MELYRETGRKEYLALASRMIERRGHGQLGGTEYLLDHAPVREATAAAGHAVRQLYLACGVVDVYLETGDSSLLEAAKALWHDIYAAKAYVTGGLGARESGESFGDPYELPAATAYAETCAAIAGFMFNWRLLLATGELRFVDEMERALYNAIAVGVGEDGRTFFYANPLASYGGVERRPWFACCCCPTNVARFAASLQHYVATGDDRSIHLHLLANARIVAPAAELQVETAYPWDGRVEITVRRPVDGFELTVRGERFTPRDGETVVLDVAMPVRLITAHPRVDAARGQVALARGPVVYCVEQADHDVVLDDLRIDPERPPTAQNGRLEGVAGVVPAAGDVLYGEYAPATAETRLIAIPYFRWANRSPGAMRVWIPI